MRSDASTTSRTNQNEVRSAAHATGAIVLLYHRVIDLPTDPQLLAVSPQRFDEHLDVLRRVGRIMPLGELAKAVRDGDVPPRAVAITFDDGYADNFTHAAPLLHRNDAPATVFVTARGQGVRHEFWWDDLERMLLHDRSLPTFLALDVDGQRHEWNLDDINASPRIDPNWNVLSQRPPLPREGLYLFLARLLRPICEVRRRAALDAIAQWAGLPPQGRSSNRTMSDMEIVQLADGGLINIGAHTVTHPLLSALQPDEQRAEILESRRRLEAISGRPIDSFAYPFGCPTDFTDATVRLVREAGFDFACANTGRPPTGRCVVTPTSDLWRLPRAIARDVSGDELELSLRAAWGDETPKRRNTKTPGRRRRDAVTL